MKADLLYAQQEMQVRLQGPIFSFSVLFFPHWNFNMYCCCSISVHSAIDPTRLPFFPQNLSEDSGDIFIVDFVQEPESESVLLMLPPLFTLPWKGGQVPHSALGLVIALIRKQVNLGHYFKRYSVAYPIVVGLTVIGKACVRHRVL